MRDHRLDIVIGAKKLYESALRDVDRDFRSTGSKIGTYIKAGAAVAGAALATVTYALYRAAEASAAFNREMANTATLIPGNAARIRELKGDVQHLSIELGASTQDLAGGLYQVISAFGDAADSAEKLRIVATAGKAGLSTTTEALKLLSSVTKGYGDTSAAALEHVSDLAFTAVKLGQTTFPELAASMGRVVPVAAKLNVSQEELFAGFATLTGVTGQTSEISTQYAAILRGLIKPTEGMRGALGQLGYSSAEAMLKNLGFIDTLKTLIGTTDGSTAAIGKLFESGEALPALFALTGSQAATYAQKLDAVNTASGATNEALKELTTGTNELEFAVDQLKATWNVFYQRLGDFITQNPSVLNAIHGITTALKEFARIVHLDVRSDTEKLVQEIVQLERAQSAGVLSLNDGSFAAKRYQGFVGQLVGVLAQEQKQTEAATAAQKAHNKVIAEGGGGGASGAGGSPAGKPPTPGLPPHPDSQSAAEKDFKEQHAREKARAAEELAALGADPTVMSPEDVFSRAWLGYQAKLDALQQYNTQKLSLMAQAGASQAQIEAAYTQMTLDDAKKKRDFQLTAAAQTFGGMANIMQNLMVATGSRNKAMFKAMQGFAIAESLVNTYQGATKAFATVPYPFNFAAAASVIAAGMAQVAKIRSQSPEGGGGAAISTGGAAAPDYRGGSPGAYPVPTRTEPRQALNVTVNAYALDPASVNWDEMMEKQIAPALERLSGDRDVALKIKVAAR